MKHRLLTLLVVVAMMAIMTAGVSADETRKYRPSSARQTAPAICYVAGRYFLTPAEGLRRIGSWTKVDSASNDCPSALARIPFNVGFIPNGTWAIR